MDIIIVFLIIYAIGSGIIARIIRSQQSMRKSNDQVEKQMKVRSTNNIKAKRRPRNEKNDKIKDLKGRVKQVQEKKQNSIAYSSSNQDKDSFEDGYYDQFTNEYQSVFDDELEELEQYYSEMGEDNEEIYIDDFQGRILAEEKTEEIEQASTDLNIQDFRQAIIYSEILSKPKSLK